MEKATQLKLIKKLHLSCLSILLVGSIGLFATFYWAHNKILTDILPEERGLLSVRGSVFHLVAEYYDYVLTLDGDVLEQITDLKEEVERDLAKYTLTASREEDEAESAKSIAAAQQRLIGKGDATINTRLELTKVSEKYGTALKSYESYYHEAYEAYAIEVEGRSDLRHSQRSSEIKARVQIAVYTLHTLLHNYNSKIHQYLWSRRETTRKNIAELEKKILTLDSSLPMVRKNSAVLTVIKYAREFLKWSDQLQQNIIELESAEYEIEEVVSAAQSRKIEDSVMTFDSALMLGYVVMLTMIAATLITILTVVRRTQTALTDG